MNTSSICHTCSGLSTSELLYKKAEELNINPFYIEQRVQVAVRRIKQFIILDRYLNWLRESSRVYEVVDANFEEALECVKRLRTALPIFGCGVDLAVAACDRNNWKDFGYQITLEEVLGCTREIIDHINTFERELLQ